MGVAIGEVFAGPIVLGVRCAPVSDEVLGLLCYTADSFEQAVQVQAGKLQPSETKFLLSAEAARIMLLSIQTAMAALVVMAPQSDLPN
jgi:hypothetical protein